MGCERVGYAYTCQECWPVNPARWCDSCFDRFGPKPVTNPLGKPTGSTGRARSR